MTDTNKLRCPACGSDLIIDRFNGFYCCDSSLHKCGVMWEESDVTWLRSALRRAQDDAGELRKALNGTYTIKTLDWRKGKYGGFICDTIIGEFLVDQRYGDPGGSCYYVPGSHYPIDCKSVDAGKLAAEVYYRDKLLAALANGGE